MCERTESEASPVIISRACRCMADDRRANRSKRKFWLFRPLQGASQAQTCCASLPSSWVGR
eukprot:4645812-Pleurochrysis_carterae.AAC.4